MFWTYADFDEDVLNIREKKLKLSWFFIIVFHEIKPIEFISYLEKSRTVKPDYKKHCEREKAVNKPLNNLNDINYIYCQKKIKT